MPVQNEGAGSAADGAVHVDFDGAAAGAAAELGLATIDAREWGPRLRFMARAGELERFAALHRERLRPFVLTGSGDFHHLAAVWMRGACERLEGQKKLTVVCFDNHPDWDRRPPRWSCGAWVNRALELRDMERIAVWGCGNFELRWPHRVWGTGDGRLEVRGWQERVGRRGTITRENWRGEFAAFVESLGEQGPGAVYISIDLDCLAREHAVTNWEPGLFTIADLEWAVSEVRSRARVVGGDVCGAWSEGEYARSFQRFAAGWDHPRVAGGADAGPLNTAAMVRVWRALTDDRAESV